MSKSKNSLVGLWFLMYGEMRVDFISQVLEQVAQNLFLTSCTNLETGEVALVARSVSWLDGCTFFKSREEASKGIDSKGRFICPCE